MHFQETTDKKIEYNAWRKFQKFVIGLEDNDFAYYYEAIGDVLFTVYNQKNESESIAGDKYLIDTLTSYGKSLEDITAYAADGTKLACFTKPTYTIKSVDFSEGFTAVDYDTTATQSSTTATGSLSTYYSTAARIGNAIDSKVYSLTKRVDDLEMKVKDTYVNDKKENKTVELFKNMEIGKVNNPAVRLSPYGIAVKNASGTWVSYDANSGDIIDVDVFNFDTGSFLYQMPTAVKNIAVGDTIIHNRKPCFVVGFSDITGDPIVVDVMAGERKEVMPTKNMFGFDFVIRIVNMAGDMFKIKPSEDNPFGNILPFLLMSENGKMDDMLPMLLMMCGDGLDTTNPMLMYMLTKKDGTANDILPFLMMMNGANK